MGVENVGKEENAYYRWFDLSAKVTLLGTRLWTLSRKTNSELFQTERVCRWYFFLFWCKWEKVLQRDGKRWGKGEIAHHNGEKEKLLVMSNFSFSHSVFKRLVLQTHKNKGLFGKGCLTLSQTSPGFYVFAVQTLCKHYGKRRNCS